MMLRGWVPMFFARIWVKHIEAFTVTVNGERCKAWRTDNDHLLVHYPTGKR